MGLDVDHSIYAPAHWLPPHGRVRCAHLIETELGPVYDGITHFVLTAEDLPPYSSSHCLPLGLV
jgi:hypothetical protein